MKEALLAHRMIEIKAKIALMSRDPAAVRLALTEIAAIAEKQSARLRTDDTEKEITK